MADAPEIVLTDRPTLVKGRKTACPRCGAGADQRVPSGGFGAVHGVCGKCGFEPLELEI